MNEKHLEEKTKKIKSLEPQWEFDHDLSPDLLSHYYGFIYLITNLVTGKKYIGRKYFWSKSKNKKGKRVIKESDWRTYWGSCEPLHKDIHLHGLINFKREILSCHATIGQVNAAETEEQFKHNVLYELDETGEKLYYNTNIMSRYFAREDMGHMRHSTALKRKWVADRDYMINVAFGGSDFTSARVKSEYENNTEWAVSNKQRLSDLGKRDKSGELNPMFGKNHTEETKKLISENRDYTKTNWASPSYRAAYDLFKSKRWVTDEEQSRFVLPGEAEQLLSSGWRYGRTVKK